jgi:hypothetical protein
MKQTLLRRLKVSSPRTLAGLVLALCGAVYAEEPTLGALKAQGVEPLSKDEVMALLSGARLTRQLERGELHINTLKDGSINADYQAISRNTGQLRGYGSWKINDDGKYCVEIKWNRAFDNVSGCRRMYKVREDYYSAASDSDDEKLYHYKISK